MKNKNPQSSHQSRKIFSLRFTYTHNSHEFTITEYVLCTPEKLERYVREFIQDFDPLADRRGGIIWSLKEQRASRGLPWAFNRIFLDIRACEVAFSDIVHRL